MELNSIIEMFVNNGLAVCIVAFYLWKDYKFNDKLVSTLQDISNVLKDFKD